MPNNHFHGPDFPTILAGGVIAFLAALALIGLCKWAGL